jgi:hypothetical protein
VTAVVVFPVNEPAPVSDQVTPALAVSLVTAAVRDAVPPCSRVTGPAGDIPTPTVGFLGIVLQPATKRIAIRAEIPITRDTLPPLNRTSLSIAAFLFGQTGSQS